MPRLGERLLLCPGCFKRGVSLRLKHDDVYTCRYCEWFAYASGHDKDDVNGRLFLRVLNEDRFT